MSSTAGAGQALRELLDQRIAVLDGAWGTLLQGAGLTADYRGICWPATARCDRRPGPAEPDRPDAVLDLRRQYLAAGADIITTNPFTATSVGQADYGLLATGSSRWCGR